MRIAGDPRVAKSSERYQKWWLFLGTDRINKVSSWLSRVDLQIFLDVLESSAKGMSDVERMFPPRKKFMEGLLSQGLVIHSRLFLSRQAVAELESKYRKDQIPEYAETNGNTSVIYMELPNNVHILEGTHSFKIKVVDDMPHHGKILDYSEADYRDGYLRFAWLEHYLRSRRSGGRAPNHLDQTHTGPITWQSNAIDYLRNKGIHINASEMFTADHYTLYKNRRGSNY